MNRIDALCRNFLWEGRTEYTRAPLVAWDRVCLPKQEGGLGLRDLVTWNTVAVGKLAWWVFHGPDKLWVQWVFSQGDWIEKYKIRDAYNGLRDIGPKVPWFHQVWATWSVPKHRCIAWLVYQGAMNTRVKLNLIGISDTNRCYLCESKEETISHLFFDCEYSSLILVFLENWLGMKLRRENVLRWIISYRATRMKKRLIRAILNATIYFIWHQRNICRLECKMERPPVIGAKIRTVVKANCLPKIKYPVHNQDMRWLSKIRTD
ncbi:uncharacterized protein LOC141649671 [Silene latifolia]|uniref:uncharacterized protein LOC141649671 n=1 Tax=Silene latifolia TaxID=37657 RepID=UPI003D7786CB